MPRILLVASKTGYQTREFSDAAAKLGFELMLATDRCHVLDDPWRDRAFPVQFDGSTPDIPAGFDGIVAVGDAPTRTAARIAHQLGLRFHPPAAADAAANKHLSRTQLQRAGVPVPAFALATEPWSRFPAVVKPLDRTGSHGVVRVDSAEQLARRLTPNSLIEEFIPGDEYAVEALMTRGRFRALAIFDKPDPLDGPYFEETIYVTPSRAPDPVRQALLATAESAAHALGMSDGAIHAELRHNDRGAWILEVAARPIGGLCARALRFTGGVSYEELLLRHAAGDDVSAIASDPRAAAVMMIPVPGDGVYRSVSGVDDARAVRYIDDIIITAKEGQHLLPFPEGSSYPGFIFAFAPTPAGAEAAVRDAHARLHFDIAAVLPQIR